MAVKISADDPDGLDVVERLAPEPLKLDLSTVFSEIGFDKLRSLESDLRLHSP